MSLRINLTNGGYAVVDNLDYPWLSKHKWRRKKDKRNVDKWYAVTYIREPDSIRQVSMHRLIMDAPKDKVVDHEDGDSLNNQRSNLRFATVSQNMANRKMRKSKRNGKYKGVRLNRNGRWEARIQVNKKAIQVGTFECEEEAARAYDQALIKHFGEFGKTNFPRSDYASTDKQA